jgi:ABC-type multidrug transport system fused ATPase/permease subunit
VHGGIPTVLFALIARGLTAGIVTAVVFAVYTQIENHVLNPVVMSKAVRLARFPRQAGTARDQGPESGAEIPYRCNRAGDLPGSLGGTWKQVSEHEEGKMLLADSSGSYPALNVFWTIVEVFLWVIWFWILITVFIDIFRSSDLSGWGKAAWFVFVLIIPLIGVLVYLIARGDSMHERATRRAQQEDAELRSYIQQTAGSSHTTTADELEKLASLRDRGVISPAEFDQAKARILGQGPAQSRASV